MFETRVLRLRGDENWDAWGNRWMDYVDSLGEMDSTGCSSGWGLLAELRGRAIEDRQLDWGAFLFPVSRQQLLEIFAEGAELRRGFSASLPEAPARRLEDLPPDDDYGIVLIECY